MERNDLVEGDEDFERLGWIEKFKSMFSHGDEYDDDMPEEPRASAARAHAPQRPLLRMDASRGNTIYVRRDFRDMEDARVASDRLKERRPVIINFAHADPEAARRGVDFISGVVYALDGYYQKVGEQVFLFTPSNLLIDTEDQPASDRADDLYTDLR